MNEWDGDWESWTHRWRKRQEPKSKEQEGAPAPEQLCPSLAAREIPPEQLQFTFQMPLGTKEHQVTANSLLFSGK